MIERAVYSILKDDTAVAAQVSTRIYPGAAPQDAAYPYITIRRPEGTHTESTDGSSGQANAQVEAIVYSASFLTTRTVADLVRLALQGYTGTVGTDVVQVIHGPVSEDDGMGLQVEAGENYTHWFSMDFSVWFAESKPT